MLQILFFALALGLVYAVSRRDESEIHRFREQTTYERRYARVSVNYVEALAFDDTPQSEVAF